MAIHYVNHAPGIINNSLIMKLFADCGHRRPSYAKHFSQKFLGKSDGIAVCWSADCSNHRQNRASTEWSALQAAITRACDNRASLYSMQRFRSCSLVATTVLKRSEAILLACVGICTTTRTNDL